MMFLTLIFALFLVTGQALAKVSVYPVIIEATEVYKGYTFEITCVHHGPNDLIVDLSLALFDQKQDGSVIFLEDSQSVQRAKETFGLKREQITLVPNREETIEIELLKDDFANYYGVLFIKPNRPGLGTRLAVLFLLATDGVGEDVVVYAWHESSQELGLTFINGGLSHGFWEGELRYYDAGGNLGDRVTLQSGIVLAGRTREKNITVPDWVEWVEVGALPVEVTR